MVLDCEVKIPPPGRSTGPSQPKHTLRNILAAVAVLLLLVVLAFAFRSQILTGIADYLVVNDTLQPSDVIVLLNSEVNTRPFRASQLYQHGLAPAIVIARSESTPTVELGLVPNDTDISVAVMEKLGVPADKIIVLPFPGGVTSTFDEPTASFWLLPPSIPAAPGGFLKNSCQGCRSGWKWRRFRMRVLTRPTGGRTRLASSRSTTNISSCSIIFSNTIKTLPENSGDVRNLSVCGEAAHTQIAVIL